MAFEWQQVGNAFEITNTFGRPITALSSTRIAAVNNDDGTIQAYDFDGTDWSATGNATAQSSFGGDLEGLSSTSIAFTDILGGLETWAFDGTDWSQTGNTLSITGNSSPQRSAALSSTRVAYLDDGNDDLRTYDFDGTDWSQTGNDLNGEIGGSTTALALCKMTSTRIAMMDSRNENLRVYDFDGTDWTKTGNDLAIGASISITNIDLTRLADDTVALFYHDDTNEKGILAICEFDGTDWSQVGSDLEVPGDWSSFSNRVYVTTLATSPNYRVAVFDDVNADLLVYDYVDLSGAIFVQSLIIT